MMQKKKTEPAGGEEDEEEEEEEEEEPPGKAKCMHGTTGQVPIQMNACTDILTKDCCQCQMGLAMQQIWVQQSSVGTASRFYFTTITS